MKTEIKKGDKVKVKTTGEIYTTFEKMFVELGFKNIKRNSPSENCIDLIWDVINVVKQPYEKRNIAFIKSNEKELLITIKGLELVESLPTYQLTKSQIIEIAENGSLVKELVPDVFDKPLELNKWYKCPKLGKAIFYITEIFEDEITAYGFSYQGVWENENDFTGRINKDIIPATPEEVETALINEAKRRGYKNGVEIVDIYNGKTNQDTTIVSSNKFDYEKVKAGSIQGDMALRDSDGNIIFHNGNWASIIQTPKDVIKVIETYGTDKLITLIEAYDNRNSK